MQLAKLIMLKEKTIFVLFLLIFSLSTLAQDNSPYSRYGLGDLVPATNISNRGMGGISAGIADVLSVNFNNPASYASFQTSIEQHSKKVAYGRVILDVGLNFSNRTLLIGNNSSRFTSSDALFSYVQIGIPIKRNWGISFGIRPLSRMSYSISRRENLTDPVSGIVIDSAFTQYKGSGGSYLPSIGTGLAIKNFSIGFNVGYLFGRRQSNTLRSFQDSVLFYPSNFQTSTYFGDVFFNAGAQYKINLNKQTLLRLGFSGNVQHKLSASQDMVRQTYTKGTAGEILQIDSVYGTSGVKGNIIYPASYKAGFLLHHTKEDGSGWMVGIDYTSTKWSNYRLYNQADSVHNNWQLNIGSQFFPKPGTSYASRIAYRFGIYMGPDYIKIRNDLPQFGGSFGLGLPIANYNRLSPNQYSIINLSFEYAKRGNNNNLLKENIFRFSVGFNFSDLWFAKKKYD
ncbi:MAG: outer membrane protein transport protein [Flavisolibacter sp.]